MKRHGRYGYDLYPGDLIVWSQRYTIHSGRIHSITPAGKLRVYERTLYGYEQKPKLVTTDRVVKVLKFPETDNGTQQADNQSPKKK